MQLDCRCLPLCMQAFCKKHELDIGDTCTTSDYGAYFARFILWLSNQDVVRDAGGGPAHSALTHTAALCGI